MSETEEKNEGEIGKIELPAFARKTEEEESEDEGKAPLWLITFTDIMALMLTFFVLLYSMSVPLEEKWEDLTMGLNKGVSSFQSPKWYQGPVDEVNIDRLDLSRALDLRYLEAVLEEVISGNNRLENIVVIPQRGRLILSLPSDLLFEAGQADVTTDGKRALFTLGGPLSRIRNRIEVIGHADPRPIESEDAVFSSNWELSLARASNVAGVLENVGYSRSVVVRGLSSSRYDQLPDTLPEEERMSLSRRVDIVIMQDDGTQRLFLQ